MKMLTNKGEKENGRNKNLTRGGGATSSQASNLIQNFRKRLNITSLSKKIKAFTLAEVLMAKRMSGKECTTHPFSRVSKPKEPTNKMKKFAAFTLAEVLITLAIIGVVAALTIPTVITNYQKKMYVTQLKKSYNMFTNGFRTMMANEGVTKLTDTTLWSKFPQGYSTVQSEYMPSEEFSDFIKEFSKTFKVVAVYGGQNFPIKYNPNIKQLNGKRLGRLGPGMYLADGTFLWLYLNKTPDTATCNGKPCSSLKEFQETRNTKTKFWQCLGAISIDVNGAKGPNVLGRDFFGLFYLDNEGALYTDGGADYAVYNSSSCKYDNLESCEGYWKNESGYYPCTKSSDGWGCAARIIEEGWEMKY